VLVLGEEEAGALWEEDQEEGSREGWEGGQHDVHPPGREVDGTCTHAHTHTQSHTCLHLLLNREGVVLSSPYMVLTEMCCVQTTYWGKAEQSRRLQINHEKYPNYRNSFH